MWVILPDNEASTQHAQMVFMRLTAENGGSEPKADGFRHGEKSGPVNPLPIHPSFENSNILDLVGRNVARVFV